MARLINQRQGDGIDLTQALRAAVLAACGLLFAGMARSEPAASEPEHDSVLRIDSREAIPVKRQITLGLNKSMIVELPREVREVMVSNPKKLDAVLQTSTRAYVIGTDLGEASIFFADKEGHQIVTLEVTIERDLSALGDLLNRLLPNSHIQVQGIGERVVLTGTVTDPARCHARLRNRRKLPR